MNVAIYARVSTLDQNCELQLTELRDYVRHRAWSVHREYIDSGFSGAKASRPALVSLMADAGRRKFDVVVVSKLDRFGRSVLHLNQQLALLESFGIRFIATSQGLDTDHSNPTSRLLLQILASVAELERQLICERTHTGVRLAKANGKVLGRPRRVFRRDEALKLRTAGWSWRRIAEKLRVPVSPVVDACRCTEIVSEAAVDSQQKSNAAVA
jgi:putative DNA-invertase from lambdoid prophage Rac